MAIEDAIGAGADDYNPQQVLDDLVDQQARGVRPDARNINLDDLAQRLARKVQARRQGATTSPTTTSDFGSTAEDLPPPANTSEFGEEAPAGPGKPSEPEKPKKDAAPDRDSLGPLGESIGEGAVSSVGSALKGIPVGASALRKAAEKAPEMAAGGLPGLDPTPFPKETVRPEENPLYKAGEAVQKWARETSPLTEQERASFGAQVGRGIGGMVVPFSAGLVLGPAGVAVGAGAMGLQATGDTYDAAIAKGASPDDAAKAAGIDGVIGTALGALPLGVIMKPVQQTAPGLMGWATAKLWQAARSGVTFATIGEAQHYLGQQVAREFYDPKAGYDPSIERLMVNLTVGAAIGPLHPLAPGGAEAAAGARGAGGKAAPGAPPAEPAPTPGEPGPTPSPPEKPPVVTRSRPSASDDEVLRRYGYTDEDIAAMSPEQKAGEVEDARGAMGVSVAHENRVDFADVAEAKGLTPGTPEYMKAYDDWMSDFANVAAQKGLKPGTKEYMDEYDRWDVRRRETGKPKPEGKGALSDKDLEELAADVSGTRAAPTTDVATAEKRVADPTPKQAESENYQHGHLEVPELGLTGKNNISVETRAGGTRNGPIDPKTGAPTWTAKLTAAYGRIKGTVGMDGEPLDIHIGTAPPGGPVYVIDQIDPKTGKPDEHKIFARMGSQEEAVRTYLDGHDAQGPSRIGGVTSMTADEFQTWWKSGKTNKPLSSAMRAAPRETAGSRLDKTMAEADEASRKLQDTMHAAEEAVARLDKATDAASTSPHEGEVNEASAEHHAAIETAIREVGEDPHAVRPVDIARAAEIHAEEGLEPKDALLAAGVRSAVEDGELTTEQVKKDFPNAETAAALLGTKPSAPRGLLPQTGSTAAGGQAAPAEQGQHVPDRREDGGQTAAEDQAREITEAEPEGSAIADAGREAAGESDAERSTAGAEREQADQPASGRDTAAEPDAGRAGGEGAKPAGDKAAGPAGNRLTDDEQAAIDGLPAPKPGHKRLYRGEYAGEKVALPEWLQQGRKIHGIEDAEGRWFTDKPEIAAWYRNEAGEQGHIVYLDVPEAVANANRVSKRPEALKFSRDPENEFFLPNGYKGRAQPLPKAPAPVAKIVRPANPKPRSLLEFIASRGGLQPDADWEALGLDYKTRVVVPGMGPRQVMSRKRGMSLDELIEQMEAFHFLPKQSADHPSDIGVYNRVREMVDEELRGRPSYPIGYEPEPRKVDRSELLHEAEGRLQDGMEAAQLPRTSVLPEDYDLALEIMVDEGVRDPIEALERATMRNEQNSGMVDEAAIAANDAEEAYGDAAKPQTAPGDREGAAAKGAEPAEGAGRKGDEAGEHAPRAGEGSGEPGLSISYGGTEIARRPGPSVEHTAAGEQRVLPGAERISDAEHAQRGADERLKPGVAQKEPGGLFGDESKQTDLVDLARKAPEPAAVDLKVNSLDEPPGADLRKGPNIDNVSSRRTEGTETTFGKYKGYASTNDGGRLAVDAYGDTAAEAQKNATAKLKAEFAARERSRRAAAKNEHDLDGASAELSAEDADETVTVTLSRKGPWDFNDTWPAPDPEVLRRLEQEGRSVFSEGAPDVEQVVGSLDEGMNDLMSSIATVRGSDTEIEDLRSGKKKLRRGQTIDQAIKLVREQRAKAAQDARGIMDSYAEVFGDAAARAMMVETRKRLMAEERSTVIDETAAEKKARLGGAAPSAAGKPSTSDWSEIGKNAIGQTIYEDQRGVRSYIENGIRHTEPVGIIPGGGISLRERGPESEWTVTAPLAAAPESGTVPVEETAHGVPSAVRPGDAGPSPGDVQGTEPERGVAESHRGQDEGSAPALPADIVGDEAGERPGAQPAPEAGSRGDREGAAVRVPERGEPATGHGAGRTPGDAGDEAHSPAAAVKGENHSIEPGSLAEDRGWKQKAKDNIQAIVLMRTIEAEGRPATRAEQAELARYVGWGGIKGAFPDADGNYAKGFEDVGTAVKDLLTPEEYATARRSIQYAHYTAEPVVRAMWTAAQRLGFTGGQVFEPGMGVGNFAGMMPPDVAANTHYVGLELDHTTARIAKLLYPKWGVRQGDFTRTPLPDDTFDMAIGNPPFADVVIKSDPRYAKDSLFLHDYFFAKSIDGVRPGGLLAFISSAGTMNKIDTAAREYLADRALLIGAIRLPSNAFRKNAGTDVTTDIIFLQKKLPHQLSHAGDRSWTETANVSLPDKAGAMGEVPVNRYFIDHPEMVLGEQGRFDKLYEGRYAVHAPEGQDLAVALAKAIDNLPRDVMQPWEAGFSSGDIDFGTSEKKDGTFYLGPKGELMQVVGGAGLPVTRRGAGVTGGRTAAEIEKIHALIPIRDALRAVYDADMKDDVANGDVARARLNKEYDGFVKKHGPINKADLQHRRPTVIQAESARAEAREEARYAGEPFDEGSFDPSQMIRDGASLSELARARKQARQQAVEHNKPWDEGTFDPEAMPDVVVDRRPNIDPFMDDPESYRLRAIEHYDDATGKSEKGPVFRQNAIRRDVEPDIKSTNDAVLHVLNQSGRLDIPSVAQLMGKSESEIVEELGERIFKQPGTDNQWISRDEYLSGDVKDKLALAKAAAERDPEFRRNVTALDAVQPAPRPPSQIGLKLGSPWLPTDVVEKFGTEALGLEKVKVKYVPKIAQWFVSGDTDSAAAVATWGTNDRRAPALIQDALNQQNPKIYDTVKVDGGTQQILNVEKTQAAQDKIKAIRERFADWVWADQDRADRLAALYNDQHNRIVAREYNGDYLTTPGVSSKWSWRPHQTRVIARIIQSGNTYMAHAVGAGKTSAMIGSGMEMRRLGLVRKPMYVVPNHMLGQFTKEFYEQYPTARIAVADERRFHTDRRKQFIANVASDDLDGVIITHSAFGMIPISDRFQDKIVQDELDAYRELLADIPKGQENRVTRSRIEKQIERLEQRIVGRGTKKRDQVFTFEEMGVDFLFVDEAHLFRKLDFATQMGGLKGISPMGSAMAWDLYVKSLYLDGQRPGRSLVLASGTPITNTMAELYTVQRYLQRGELDKQGLARFDAWAGMYGETRTELEQNAAGGYDPVTRFRKFVNAADLSTMTRQAMDIVTSRQLDKYVTRPKIKGGSRQMNMADRSPALERYQGSLASRMEAIRLRRGPPKKGDDIMLSVINDGRHAAIDMRLVDPGYRPSKQEKSKLDTLIDNVHRTWKETKRKKFYKPMEGGKYSSEPIDVGPATQMIFANLGLNAGKRGFAVPDYIRAELARRGVPKNEIVYIADFKSHAQRQRLFNDMNEGKVRILIGSTAKMATGVNAQRRLYAIHNLDPLWYPADDEQRNGRGLRQGNWNPEIEIHDYSTQGTYDSSMWKMMANKATFIRDFYEGDPSLIEMEDLGEASQYEQAAAMTTSDPRLMHLTELKQELEKANRRWGAFEGEQYAIRRKRADAKNDIASYERRIGEVTEDLKIRQDISGDKFQARLGKKTYDKRPEFGDAVLGVLDNLANEANVGRYTIIGEIGGFPLVASARKRYGEKNAYDAELAIRRSGHFERGVSGSSALGIVRSMELSLGSIEDDLDRYKQALEKQKKFLAESAAAATAKFTGEGQIAELTAKVRALEAELAATEKKKGPEPIAVNPNAIPGRYSLEYTGPGGVISGGFGLADEGFPFRQIAAHPELSTGEIMKPVREEAAQFLKVAKGDLAHALALVDGKLQLLRDRWPGSASYYEEVKDAIIRQASPAEVKRLRDLELRQEELGGELYGGEPRGLVNWLRSRSPGGALEPPTTYPELSIVPSAPPTFDEFTAMAQRGKVRQAAEAREDLANILAKRIPAADFEIAGAHHPFSQQYESGQFVKRLQRAGLFVDDDRMGNVYVGTTAANLSAIKGAKTALEFGRAYGYSDEDAAAFYVKRRHGRADIAYQEFVRDWVAAAGASPELSIAPAPPFFSAVERAVSAAKMEKARPDQWLGTIKNAPGVKPEELQWLGLTEWLGSLIPPPPKNGEKAASVSVSKADVLGYIRANQIEVKEVQKGGPGAALSSDIDDWMQLPPTPADDGEGTVTWLAPPGDRGAYPDYTGIEVYHNDEGELLGYASHYAESHVGSHGTFEEAARAINDAMGFETGSGTKFQQYTLPGGTNYRELLLTLPEKPSPERGPQGWGNTAGGTYDPVNFRSGHWSEPNVVAHVRFDGRMTPIQFEEIQGGGKPATVMVKTLHIAEVQSDWHQLGRKKGYLDPAKKAELQREAVEARKALDKGITRSILHTDKVHEERIQKVISNIDERLTRFPADQDHEFVRYFQASDHPAVTRYMAAARALLEFNRSGVPDAPFKTTWPELAMKRIIRYAAENGYDRITWDTGATNADRYDLSKQVNKIEWSPWLQTTDQHIIIHVPNIAPIRFNVDHGGIVVPRGIAGADQFLGKHLSDVLGKDVAEKIIASHRGSLEGEGLRIGGEGMRGFYDDILPAAVNKIVKKYGAKVGTAQLRTHDDSLTIFRGNEKIDTSEAKPVHSLDITDSLRKAALAEGFPLFHLPPSPRGERYEAAPSKPKSLPPESYLTKPALDHRARIETGLTEQLQGMLGKHVTVKFTDRIPLSGLPAWTREQWGNVDPNDTTAAAAYYPAERLIEVALADPRYRRPDRAAWHEAMHFAEDHLFTDKELDLAKRETPRMREFVRRNYDGSRSDEQIDSISDREIRAEAFRFWAQWRAEGQDRGRGLHIGIRKMFHQLELFFDRIRNWMRGHGFQNVEDVFSKLYEGKMADRDLVPTKIVEHTPREIGAAEASLVGDTVDRARRGYDESKLRRGLKDFWTSAFQPELVSDKALMADPLFARYRAAGAQEKDAIIRQSEAHWDFFNRRSAADNLKFLDNWERGLPQGDPELDAIAEHYKAILTAGWEKDQRWGSTAAFVEDYMPHVWERPDDFRKMIQGRTAQIGPTWFQKHRFYDFIEEGLEAGLKLRFSNPIDLINHRLLSGVDMRQRMELLYKLRDMGLAKRAREEGVALIKTLSRRGWEGINAPDRALWYIAPDVQPLWKNAVEAKGLWQAEHVGGTIFRKWMTLKNVWVPVKLALSMFHPLHVLHIDQANSFARAWTELTRNKDPGKALQAAGEALATFPTLGAVHARQGGRARAAWAKRPDEQSPEDRAIVALMTDGGFSPQLSEQLKISARKRFAELWQQGKYVRALPAGMRRSIEVLQAPIFERWIPSLKAAAYLNEVHTILRRRPELLTDDVQRRAAFRTIGKAIDDRFGEMFYSGLFWNRTGKDVAIGSFLSLGWNLGFARQFLAAPGEAAAKVAFGGGGKGGSGGGSGSGVFGEGFGPEGSMFHPSETRRTMRNASSKVPFVLAYVSTAMAIAGLMSWALSGESPTGIDFIFPRVGGTNPDGSPRRITTMFYTREVPMLLKHVQERGGNWLSGAAAMLWNKLMFQPFKELYENRSYWGYDIWDPNAPLWKQAWQAVKHVLGEQTHPMSVSGAQRGLETGGTWTKDVPLAGLGFGPAPRYVEKSAAQNRIAFLYERRFGGTRTEEEGERARDKVAARNAVLTARQNKDSAAFQAAVKQAREAGLSADQINKIGRTPSDVSMFKRLPEPDQKAILGEATDQEFAKYLREAHKDVKALPEVRARQAEIAKRAGPAPRYTPGVFGSDGVYTPPAQ